MPTQHQQKITRYRWEKNNKEMHIISKAQPTGSDIDFFFS